MADLVNYGHSDRDIDQALTTLKKGTLSIKYSRKGKPKFCPFRISADEKTLIWLSHGEERSLKLSLVSRIIQGQRTAVFRRYLRPEKDYLSFSLIYNNGDRSLDLICKDKAEAEVWLAGLKGLIGQQGNRRIRSEVLDLNEGEYAQNGRPFGVGLEVAPTVRSRTSVDLGSSSLDVGFGSEQSNMQVRGSTGDSVRLSGDGFRLSVSSTPSCSSQGSGPDDIESLGDVYVWGELWSDGGLTDGSGNPYATKVDVLIPKPLESNVVLDVHQIACGVQHIALVTRQGEVFTWGEESGGRLGHGIERDFTQPHIVEFLAVTNVDFVACGEYHTCAVSTSGDLFTWGDGVYHVGLLGHGTDASHWIPKRVSGPLEGLQVYSIACGPWHSAITTSNGKLFTFGDGTFGVLGHGDRESVTYPKEVRQLNGLRTIKVACGVWHTAAIVEVMSPTTAGTSIPSRKLFTWGDGDKYRLGHGSKDPYLHPTCVSTLIDYNFQQIACGHDFTVALTTSGHVFTMGSTSYGQLGNPQADGKVPCLVQDKLIGEFVEEISCGAHHVAVLTSRSEIYTWGKGANGRLGHGDVEDRKSPTFVEALKERHVKSVACGSNLTAVICIHKWVSGADQSVCSGCRQAFGFTRKRHNCYNCGLVHCHACSSRKAIKAALAPTPSKPHRVCDACYNKLKTTATGNASLISKKPTNAPRHSIDSTKERSDRVETRSSRLLLSPSTEAVKYQEVKNQRYGGKSESFSMVRASQVPSFQQLKDVSFPSSLSALQSALRPVTPSPPPAPPPPSNSPARPSSPYTRRPSPPRSGTPVVSRGVLDSLKKSNELLSQEVSKLQNHLKNLKLRCDTQDEENKKLQKNAREASLLAADKSSKCKFAREVAQSFTVQVNDIIEKLPNEAGLSENLKAMQAQFSAFIEASRNEASTSQPLVEQHEQKSSNETSTKGHKIISLDSNVLNDLSTSGENAIQNSIQTPSSETTAKHGSEDGMYDSSGSSLSNVAETSTNERLEENGRHQESNTSPSSNMDPSPSPNMDPSPSPNMDPSPSANMDPSPSPNMDPSPSPNMDPSPSANMDPSPSPNMDPSPNQSKIETHRSSQAPSRSEAARENIEQFEPGVYVTFIQLRNGTNIFRRVRFSKKKFKETRQAEEWWKHNNKRVFQKYIPPPQSNAPSSTSSPNPSSTTSPLGPSSSEGESNASNF